MTYFSRILKMCALMLALLMLASCSRGGETGETEAKASVHIEQSSYYYEQGYMRSGGWWYEMTIASDHQLSELNKMADALVLNWTGEDFLVDQGYLLHWKDASGNLTKELLIIDGKTVSMEGILYEAPNVQPLYDWLEALEIVEQSVE